MTIVISLLTLVLVLVCVFLVLVVLAQKPKSDGGMGAALGGGMTEATFGADTGNVLSKATINSAIVFFVLSFALYLGHIWQRSHGSSRSILPAEIPAEASAAPAAAEPSTSVTAEPAATTTPAPPASPAPATPAPEAAPAPAPAGNTAPATEPATAP
ncbi:MAG: preprotein translocase subunit SecG [Opitutaceae bacterium]|jgi:preprotein translocase subunit SecG|nr:preprotein translocase subunit SecG [Opitutaceae bacterium]